jgi:hypothetical protein
MFLEQAASSTFAPVPYTLFFQKRRPLMLGEDFPVWLLKEAVCWRMKPTNDRGLYYFMAPDGVGFFGWEQSVVNKNQDCFPKI